MIRLMISFAKIRSKIASLVISAFVELITFLFFLRKRDYQETRNAVLWAFVVNAWKDLKGNEPVDLEDQLFEDLVRAYRYFSLVENKRRTEVSRLEKTLLPDDFSYWFLRDDPITYDIQAWKTVRKHQLVESIRYYRNIQFKSNAIAEEELHAIGRSSGSEANPYWGEQVKEEALPKELCKATKTKQVRKWARQHSKRILREIGEEHQIKYAVSLGDIATVIAMLAALMATLSYSQPLRCLDRSVFV